MPNSEQIKYISPDEFYHEGYLQEVNRQFFHPLGLALSMTLGDNDKFTGFGQVWDYREDPEGMIFHNAVLEKPEFQAKADNIKLLQETKAASRQKLLKYVIQGTSPVK